jgi:hypothetical protein
MRRLLMCSSGGRNGGANRVYQTSCAAVLRISDTCEKVVAGGFEK